MRLALELRESCPEVPELVCKTPQIGKDTQKKDSMASTANLPTGPGAAARVGNQACIPASVG